MPLQDFQKKSKETTEKLKKELSGIRANRPTTALVENIQVEYYGQKLPLKQIASIGVIPPREITIQAWDKEAVPNIIKSIETSPLGLSANPEGTIVRLHLPELSGERREELSRHVKKETEKYRIELRHLRDEINKKIQKMLDNREISEDAKFKLKNETQKITDKTNEEIEKILDNKMKEINE